MEKQWHREATLSPSSSWLVAEPAAELNLQPMLFSAEKKLSFAIVTFHSTILKFGACILPSPPLCLGPIKC